MKNSNIDLDGLKIHYSQEGSGNPLIILHGWGISSQNFLELQKNLAQKFAVFNLDLPGFGQSDLPKEPWEVSDYAVIVQQFIEKLKLKNVHLFGHSFGGRVAIKFAARRPAGLKSLILCCSAGIKPKNTLKKIIFKTIAKTGKFIFQLPLFNKLSSFAKKILYQAARENDYVQLDNEIMKKTFINIIDEDLTPLLPEISLPTLLLWGELDQLTPLNDGLLMDREIEDSDLKIFAGIGHKLPYAKPKEVSEAIFDFIK